MKNKKKIRCSNCGSTQVWTRITTNERVCRTCGYIENLNKEKKK